MLFYKFIFTKINSKIILTLKNDLQMTGTLKNIDPYLNFTLTDISILSKDNISLQNMDLCLVKGFSIRHVFFDKIASDLVKLNDGTRFHLCDLNNLIVKEVE